jgi:hypothetical protein
VQGRFLAKGRGVIGLPLQQPQVATRVTRFLEFCLFASQLRPWHCALCGPSIYSVAGLPREPLKVGAVAVVMWNMRRRHSSHSCQPAAAEPSVKADQREPRQRSKRSGEPLRTTKRRLNARKRAGMPVPPSRFVLSTGSPSGSRRLLPQEPPAVRCAIKRRILRRFPPQEPPATLQHPSRGDVSQRRQPVRKHCATSSAVTTSFEEHGADRTKPPRRSG